jgi:hypothetical protein
MSHREPQELWEIADSHHYFISKMSRMTHRKSRSENSCVEMSCGCHAALCS